MCLRTGVRLPATPLNELSRESEIFLVRLRISHFLFEKILWMNDGDGLLFWKICFFAKIVSIFCFFEIFLKKYLLF